MAISAKFAADFSQFQSAVTDAQSKLASFETGAGKVATALGKLETSLSGRTLIQNATLMAEAVTRLGGSAGTAGGILRLTDKELQTMGATASEAAAKLTAMGKAVPDSIQQIATAAEKATKSLKATGEQLQALGGAATAVGTRLSAAITAPLVAAAAAGLYFAAGFEKEMTKVQALAGASADEVKKMGDAILVLAPKVGVGPEELAKGLFVLESAGFKGAEALDLLTTSAKMAALGMGETEAISRSLVGVMLTYTKENLSAAQAGDLLVKTVQLGNMKVEELVPALARVNPLAAAMGIHFTDVAAAIATFTHMGASTEIAAVGLRAVLSNILNDSAKTEKGFIALQKVTGDLSITMADFKARMNNEGLGEALLHLMEQANSAGDKGIEALNKVFPNIKALTEVLAIAGSQADNYRRITSELQGAGGTLETSFAAVQKTFTQQWKELTAQVDVVLIQFGNELMPLFKHVVQILKDDVVPVLAAAVKAFGELPDGVKTATIVLAGLLAVIGPGVFVLGSFVAAAGELVKMFQLLTAAEIGLGGAGAVAGEAGLLAFLANPVVLGAAVAIGGIALAVYELHKNLALLERHSNAGQPLQGLTGLDGKPIAPKLSVSDVQARTSETQAPKTEALGGWTPEAGDLVTGTTLKMGAGFKLLREHVDAAAAAHQTLAEKVQALTAAEKASIEQNMARESVAQLAEELNLDAKVVAAYEKIVRAATTAETATAAAVAATTQLWDDYAQATAKAAGDSLEAQLLGVTKWYDGEADKIEKSKASETAKAAWSVALNADYYARLQAVREKEATQREAADAALAARTIQLWDEYYKATATADEDALGAKLANEAKWYDAQYADILKSKANETKKLAAFEALNTAYYGRLEALRATDAAKQATANAAMAAKTIGFYDDATKAAAKASGQTLKAELANEAKWYDAQYADIVKAKADEATKADALLALNTDYYDRLLSLDTAYANKRTALLLSLDVQDQKVREQLHGRTLASALAENQAELAAYKAKLDAEGLLDTAARAKVEQLYADKEDVINKAEILKSIEFYSQLSKSIESLVPADTELGKITKQFDGIATAATDAAKAVTQFGAQSLQAGLAGLQVGIAWYNFWAKLAADQNREHARADEAAHDKTLAAQFGLTGPTGFSQQLNRQLFTEADDMESSFVGSLSQHVNDIVKELGGWAHLTADQLKTLQGLIDGVNTTLTTSSGLTHMAAVATGLFAQAQGQGPIAVEATNQLDHALADMGQASIDAGQQVSQFFLDSIDKARRLGIVLPEVAKLLESIAATVATGLGDLLMQPLIASFAGVGKAVTDAQKALDDLKATGTATAAQLKTAQDVLTAALTAQHGEAVRNKQALDDIGTAAVTAFNAAIASGQTFLQALALIAPSLDTIQQAYKDIGLAIDDATLRGLILENTILRGTKEHPSSLGTAIGGNQAAVTGSMNFGPAVETNEAFAAQQRQTLSLYTQAQAASANAGVTGAAGTAAALLPFQGTLHALDDWAKKHNVELDANTRQMIDQSKDLGIWTDTVATDGEQTRQSIADLIKSQVDLAKAMGKVEDAMNRFALSPPLGPGNGGAQATGGDYMVTKPTLFLAGEAGAERATFTPIGKPATQTTGGSTVVLQEAFTFQVTLPPGGIANPDYVEKELMPQIIGQIEDHRRGFTGRLRQALEIPAA